MADSEALRSRRKRFHKSGDHSLCRRCAAVSGESRVPRGVASVAVLSDGTEGRAFDAAVEMRQLARDLAVAYGADTSNALLARELRMTLQALLPKGSEKPDADLAGLFAALRA